MKSVKLNFFLIFFMEFGLACQGYADCPPFVKSNTTLEAGGKKGWEGFLKIISLGTAGSFEVDEKLYQYITVKQVKDQGIDGYFNPKIQVCDYEGKDNCYILPSGTSCRQIYGTQGTGGGVSAAVFIDWEGDKTLSDGTIKKDDDGKIEEGIAKGLRWGWAEGVTKEEQDKFANSPKICACSQKGACMDSSAWFSRVVQGENIFRPGDMAKACDTCYQTKIKCAPVPLAPGPPPFCEQLAMSPPQVRIIPITNKENDYFDPKVGVMISGLEERKELGFQKASHEVEDGKGTTYYFETYRKKDKLCTKYLGTQSIDEKNPQFVRCFPAPSAPEPEVVKTVDQNTLEIKMKMKMNSDICSKVPGNYSNGVCIFDINRDGKKIGPLSLKVVKPAIVAKTTDSNNKKSYIDNIIEGILESNPQQFKVLKEYGYVPDIETECKELKEGECKLDNLGQPKIEIKYKENDKSKMLCLSGWQPEPEEFVLEREGKVVPLKSMGTRYIKYSAVYSKESNQFYYLPNKENKIADLLNRSQSELDEIIFNKLGYVFFPEENKQEKGKCNYCVDEGKGEKIDDYFMQNKVKVVYKLTGTDVEHEEECKQGHDGCTCPDNICHRSTKYKNKGGEYFFLKSLKDKNGLEYQEVPIKANRTEVFYADKLCRFDLAGLKNRLREIIVKQLKDKKQKLEENGIGSYDLGDGYTDDLSIIFDRVEIEAWGSGEAGHIAGKAFSTKSRPGMPGDYIKAKLKIDPDYPIIKVKVTEGGGNQENRDSNKDGGAIFIKECRLDAQECKDLITIAGGGMHRTYGGQSYRDTIIYRKSLEERIITADALKSTEDNEIAYIENGEIKYETVKCSSGFRSSKPGAGGCTDKSKLIYVKGSTGYVKIRPIIKEFNVEEINDAIEKVIGDQYDLGIMTDFSIGNLNVDISKIIEEEVKKELLGQ